MKRPYCIYDKNSCENCSLTNYGLDCMNNPVNQLAYLRKKAGLKQSELAEKIGMNTQVYISKLENGTRSVGGISANKAYDIAQALGVTVEELLNK